MSSNWLFVVSGDPQVGSQIASILEEARLGSIKLLRGSAECIGALGTLMSDDRVTVIVDGVLEDVAPLNLVGSIRQLNPHAGIVLTVTPANDAVVERAMLAGARAVVERTKIRADLLPAVQRVVVTATSRAEAGTTDEAPQLGKDGAVVAFVGARGGAGRSTLSALSAISAAGHGLDVGLLDLDLQFGDLAFLFDANPRSTLVDFVQYLGAGTADPTSFGTVVSPGVTLYCPSPQSEQAELVAPRIGQVISRLRAAHDLVVINTGPYWTTFHAELFESIGVAVFVLDQTGVGVRATVQAKQLSQKLGLPDGRMVFVMNQDRPKGNVSAIDAATALRVASVITVPDGGQAFSAYLDAGDVSGVLASDTTVQVAVRDVLFAAMDAAGKKLTAAPTEPAKKSRLFGGR